MDGRGTLHDSKTTEQMDKKSDRVDTTRMEETAGKT